MKKQKLPNGAYISEGELVFVQSPDSMNPNPQELRVHIDDAGGGLFFAITTDRWSVDSADEFLALLRVVGEFIKKMKQYGYQEEE